MMLTRCPGCATTFRVTPEQVKARHGQVRCGRCQHVFDAIEFLVDATPVTETLAPAPITPEPPEAAEPISAPSPPTAPDTIISDTVEAFEPPAEPAPTAEAEIEPESAFESLSKDEAPNPTPETDDILLQPSPLSAEYAQATDTRDAPRWPWLVAATLALLALIAQAAVSFRGDLAVKYPELRPALEMLCEQASCVIELPSNPELVSIEGSDLHPGRKEGLELTATLRNRAAHAQAWPYLELTLTDGADKPIVRRVIEPEQYLPVTQSATDGFAANGELAVQLALDSGNLPAAGYRLYLFYP